MPPAAISRSSTYLPKIWGNIARPHGSALGLALLLLTGCGETPPGRVLPIRAVRPPECGPAAPTTIQLEALGDFDASPFTSETVISQSKAGTALGFPAQTRAVEARGEGGGTRFLGLGENQDGEGIELLLLPDDRSCELHRPGAEKPYPLAIGGHAVGVSRRHRVLLVAGSRAPSGDSARALALDVDTLEASDVPGGMLPGRAHATITELGDDALLVAGGVDPTETALPEIDSAIVYDVVQNRFERAALIPTKPRARHGAVVLESGDTLLVGGTVSDEISASLELISPIDRAASIPGAALSSARIEPTVLRLDDGRVLVAGGIDAAGDPVRTLEWLSADASEHLEALELNVSSHAAFAPMPGGGVLAVGVCEPGPGCSADPSAEISWIRANLQMDRLPPLPFPALDTELVAGSDGAPILIATSPAGRVVLRFDPWSARFVALDESPEIPPPAGASPVAIDPGMFVWLEPFGDALAVRAFRHSTRGRWARDVAPLAVTGTMSLAPDRRPGTDVSYTGDLVLAPADPSPRVFISDTTYESLRLEIAFANGPPVVALDDALFGQQQCPWPASDSPLVLTRRSSEVTLSSGGQSVRCNIAPGRVRIALLPGATTTEIDSVRIGRSAD